MARAIGILVAAGSGSRLPSATPKQFLSILGKPLLVHTVDRFRRSGVIDRLVVVLPREGFESWKRDLEPHWTERAPELVPGGASRQDSVAAGLGAIAGTAEPEDLVVVHDGARPGVPPSLIVEVVKSAERDGAAIAAVPVVETLKQVGDDLLIVKTVARERYYRAQTPQCFRYALLREAMDRAVADGFQGTDEAALVERIGAPIRVVAGSERNLKVTTAEDLDRAEYYLEKEEAR